MRKILKWSVKNHDYVHSLPKIYIIGCWARWGIMELPFVKLDKENIPLVYNYNDHNGTVSQYELIPITQSTSGKIFDWSFYKNQAQKVADMLNERDGLKL